MRVSRIIIAAGAGLGLLAAGTAAGAAVGAAIAASPISKGIVHGCYTSRATRGSHTVVLQNVGTRCSRGTTAISWNQKGQRGATGATGARGATGAQGPAGPAGPSTAGPNGLDVRVIPQTSTNVFEAVAICPASHPYVLGGGGFVEDAPFATSVPDTQTTAPLSDGSGWEFVPVIAPDPGKDTVTDTILVYAICAK